MEIIDFNINHIEQATKLVKENYSEACKHTIILPQIEKLPDLTGMAKNGLGVAAFENGDMIGFLSCFSPFQNAFGSTSATGVFSPLHGSGVVRNNRTQIYAYMYQMAARKWIEKGVTSHAICLYAHDKKLQELLYQYGFGLRCIDAIRSMVNIDVTYNADIVFSELEKEKLPSILPLNRLLIDHLEKSPTFYKYPVGDDVELLNKILEDGNRYFVATKTNRIVAYLKIDDEGENFVSDSDNVINICGAFCLPEYRGGGLFSNLVNFAIASLKNDENMLLGVDFESFNPTAYGFWLKHFEPYTYSVVRRIDEYVLE